MSCQAQASIRGGEQGSDTSINLQEVSVPWHTPSPLPHAVPDLCLRLSPVCCSPGGEINLLIPREKRSQITNACIFLVFQPRAFQYAMDFYLSFSIIHLPSPPHFLFPVGLRLSLSLSLCVIQTPQHCNPLAIQWHVCQYAYGQWRKCMVLCSEAVLNGGSEQIAAAFLSCQSAGIMGADEN